MLTIDKIFKDKLVLLDCISGSQAYGLALPTSDLDKRGLYHMPKKVFYGLEQSEQVSNATNDEVYTELARMIALLSKANPTMIELMCTTGESVLYKHPLLSQIDSEMYLSKKCMDTFAGYAVAQVKKARSLKKKVLNPIDKKRKTVLDFCFVSAGQDTLPVQEFLKRNSLSEQECGLAKINRMTDMYGLYVGEGYKGIVGKENSNEVLLSNVQKGAEPIALMCFNVSAYSAHCKEYKAYWDWVEKRNEDRYENTIGHGKNYDAKNMMHTFRLLNMAKEIAEEGKVFVQRSDRDFLLSIRNGDFEYEYLLKLAEEKIAELKILYTKCELREVPDTQGLEEVLVEIRVELYQ